MKNFKKISLAFLPILLSFIAVFPVLAEVSTTDTHTSGEEASIFHAAIMILLAITIFLLMIICWNCGKLYGGTMGNGFKMIGIGIGILGLKEVFTILDHFEMMVWGSTAGHILSFIGFIVVGIGLWTIYKYITSPEGKLGKSSEK